MRKSIWVAAAASTIISTAAFAAVTFDSESGTGFVGKGDVQLALGLNNAQLQAQANSLVFAVTTTSETTWTCDRDAGPQTQERTNTSTTSGLLTAVARVRNQVTGFNLLGYDGGEVVENDGPAVGSCPTFWTAIDIVTTPGDDALISVNGVPLQ